MRVSALALEACPCLILCIGFHPVSVEQYDRLMNVNAKGVFLCYKHAAKRMIEQGKGGRIIGASSLAGKAVYYLKPVSTGPLLDADDESVWYPGFRRALCLTQASAGT